VFCIEHVVEGKAHLFPDFRKQTETFPRLGKIFVQKAILDIFNTCLCIYTLGSARQHLRIDVGGEDVHIHRQSFLFEQLMNENCHGIGFFTHGATGRPDSQGMLPLPGFFLENFRQHPVSQQFKGQWVAKELTDIDGQHTEEFVDFVAVSFDKKQIFV